MPTSINIDELVANIERAKDDPATPSWVGVLLQTVLLLVTTMQRHFDEMSATVTRLEAENTKLRKELYGKKSERKPRTPSAKPPKKKSPDTSRTGPSALDAADLSEEVVEHEVPDEEKKCAVCGGEDFVDMPTDEESVLYTYKPARLVRVRHKRKKCACRNGCSIITAPAPPKVVEGGRFSSSLYADVVTKRSFDAIPFHRQADAFQRAGIPLSASTLCDLFHTAANVLAPLYNVLLDEIRAAKVVHADETPQPVIEAGGTKRSYVWTFTTPSLAAYVHSGNRSSETPLRILQDSRGTLTADGYSGYNIVTTPDSRLRAGCLVHARRKFVDAEDQAYDEVQWLVERIAAIYAIEKRARDSGIAGTEQHLELRQQETRPIMDEIREWLTRQQSLARPKSAFGKAVGYADKQWSALTVFLDDPAVSPDNNLAERMLRRIALARRTSMFVQHDESGQRYAINMSLVASCRLNDIDPTAYLTDVLTRIADYPAKRVAELLPDRWEPAA